MITYMGKATTTEAMVVDLRLRGIDSDNELTDDYLIDEAWHLGEWE